MLQLIMLMGVAGSGKSTWAKRYIELENKIDPTTNIYILSSDELRKELYGDENDQTHNTEVFKELHKRVLSIFNTETNAIVIYDATNLNRKRRIAFLNSLPNGVKKNIIVFPISFFTVMERMKNRERKVPDYAVLRQFKQMEFPQWYEGWDNINIELTESVSCGEVLCNMNIPHDNHHHKKNIVDHSLSVANHFRGTPEWYFTAALFHDCGKPLTKQFRNMKDIPTDEAHYYGHEHYGAQLSCLINDGLNYNSRIARAQLIDLHMEHYRKSDDKLAELFLKMDFCKAPNYVDLLNYRVTSEKLKELNKWDKEEA